MNNQQDYPTDVLPEDRKQERIVELERKLKQAEARLADAVAALKRIADEGPDGDNDGKIMPSCCVAFDALERLEVKK